jgi:magnesium-transporting ATPase (P-type)
MKKTNEDNLESVQGMAAEFKEEVEFMAKKFQYIEENNPFDMNLKLVNKIYDNIIELVNKKREEALFKMTSLRDNYMKNIQQNIAKVQNMIDKSDNVSKKLSEELAKIDLLCQRYGNNDLRDFAYVVNKLNSKEIQEDSKIHKEVEVDINSKGAFAGNKKRGKLNI